MRFTLLAAAFFAASQVQAAGDALVIGNSQYDAVQTFFGASKMSVAAESLRAKGFDVSEASDGSAEDMQRAFADFVLELEPKDSPVVILLAGIFVNGPLGTYLLPVDDHADTQTAGVLTRAFPLDAALTILAGYPGRAFLVLGENPVDLDSGRFLRPGVGRLDLPSGVTVIRGPSSDVARFAARELTNEDRFVLKSARQFGLDVAGYSPSDLVVLRSDEVVAVDRDPLPYVDPQADDAAWRLAQQADTANGYRTYLQGFPQGQHAAAARQRVNAITSEPFYRERRGEERLELSRDQRRKIQRDLSLLGYDPRGIDGIFGKGSRRAIAKWQKDMGYEGSGYLTREFISRLDDDAAKRAQQLEDEAKKRQAEQERQDRAFWAKTMQRADEDSLREYVARYPEGVHANDARRLLREIGKRRGESVSEQDQKDWSQARRSDTVAAYQSYLKLRPNGDFVNEARSRIAKLKAGSGDNAKIEQAQREEQALRLNSVARQLAETRLAQLGMKPGNIDGKFDKKTRAAIRRYQTSRKLDVTGFLDEETVVNLLAGGLLGR